MHVKKLVAGLGFCSLLLTNYAVAASDQTITYQNQRGSSMILVWHSEHQNTGTLSGKFTTAVGNCAKDVNVPLPLTGYFNGNAIALSVNFPHCKQVIAMTGNVSQDQTNIHTLWLDANQAEDPTGKDWNSNIVGADSYTRVKS